MEQHRMVIHSLPASGVPVSIGAAANGDKIATTAHHLLRDGKPWYPVMGEFHFSRYPAEEWETELRKMKALGVQIVATYVFWIHHEEERGVWRTDGNLDLQRFVKTCQKVGLDMLLRIGPWAHGECRNGGFPDWLVQDQTMQPRTDDPKYLALVEEFFGHIAQSVQGLLLKDGGPIIGIQIENEYGHCGGESGGSGLIHMMTLKRLAIAAGLKVPMYTATGWGGGNVVDGEMLPVMGGYADAPWEHHLNPLPASPNFLLMHAPNDPLIGSDWNQTSERFTYRVADWPYLTAELGGGNQCTFHRRPLITAEDTVAQALCKLASGANLLGYYMFHGGTNPIGKLTTLQESTASGSWTDVPVMSYDFEAPLGEAGNLNESAYGLKNLHLLVQDWGESLAASMCYYPENQVKDAENLTDLRWCVRYNQETQEGFLFINNHQRLRRMQPHTDVRFTITVDGKTFDLPPMDIPSDFCGVIPFHLRVGKGRLMTTNACLLCSLNGTPVLYSRDKARVETHFDGEAQPLLLLSDTEARSAWRIGNELMLSDACLLPVDGRVLAISETAEITARCLSSGEVLHAKAEVVTVDASFTQLSQTEAYTAYRVTVGEVEAALVDDVLLDLDFSGDHADVLLDGVLVADWYTTGAKWQLPLRRHGFPKELEVRVYPVTKPTYFEIPTPQGMTLNHVQAHARYALWLDAE